MTPPVEKGILDIITAIATLITPFLLIAIGGLGWQIKNKVQVSQSKEQYKNDRIRELENKLREDRIEIYNAILKPFFLLFTSEEAFSKDPKFKKQNKDELAITKMLSVEYREVGFKLSLIANDSVVRCYNRLMQYFTIQKKTQDQLMRRYVTGLRLWVTFYLRYEKAWAMNPAAWIDGKWLTGL